LVSLDRPSSKTQKPVIKPGGKSAVLSEIADKLSDQLSTRVKIQLGKGRGTIAIDFANLADLNRILDEMGYQRD
jgi:ParB family chromosome partitioning protein